MHTRPRAPRFRPPSSGYAAGVTRSGRKHAVWAGAVAAGLLAAGWSGSSTAGLAGARATLRHGKARTVRVSTRRVDGLGQVLVDSRGRTLYMFVPDKRRKVTCVGNCAVVWPPLKLAKGAKPAAAGKARQKLLGSDRDPAGGRVVTYARWPLYTYVGDTAPGTASGQALNLNGGLWYVLAPSGKLIRKKPS
jgi:predicted lipoprotein with Yx(FWY)xxD motif